MLQAFKGSYLRHLSYKEEYSWIFYWYADLMILYCKFSGCSGPNQKLSIHLKTEADLNALWGFTGVKMYTYLSTPLSDALWILIEPT